MCFCVCVTGVGRGEGLHQPDLLPAFVVTEIVGSTSLWIPERTKVPYLSRARVFTEDHK